jgi:hypothetical protein
MKSTRVLRPRNCPRVTTHLYRTEIGPSVRSFLTAEMPRDNARGNFEIHPWFRFCNTYSVSKLSLKSAKEVSQIGKAESSELAAAGEQRLLRILKNRGFTIRVDWLGGRVGCVCLVRGQPTIFLDASVSKQERLEFLQNIAGRTVLQDRPSTPPAYSPDLRVDEAG